MTCCNRSVSWECVYPDLCGCDNYPDCICCQGSDCQAACGSSAYCGVGGCCSCNSSNWAFAWKSCGSSACGWCIGCNVYEYFSSDCTSGWFMAYRCDTHGAGYSTMADLTKALFLQFAPLSQGIINGMRISDNLSCC